MKAKMFTGSILIIKFIFIISVSISAASSLPAETLTSSQDSLLSSSFLEGSINTDTHLLNLETKINADKHLTKEVFEEGHFSFAFTGTEAFKENLKAFLTATERKRSLIDYQVVDDYLSGRLQISAGGGIDYHTSFDSSYIHPFRRFQINGNIHNRLLFWGDWRAGRFQGDLPYAERTSPLLNGWYKSHSRDSQKYTNLDRLSGQITYLFGFGNVSIGRGVNSINDNIGGSTILNDRTNDYGYFSSEIRFGKLKLSFLHASLIPNERDPVYSDLYHGRHYVDKFLVQHQINYSVHDNFDVYFGEQVVYANRSIDFSYLLPHTFYRITEHNLHDRDSMRIYAGGRWDAARYLSFYGSIMLDELRKSEIFSDWWGNKYALQGGISANYLQGLLHPENEAIKTTFEMTGVRPWTYTHNKYMTNLSHDGVGLGFPAGSNLIQGAMEINFPLLPYLRYDQFLSFTAQGSKGSCWCLNYTDDREKDTAKWLEGEVTDTLKGKGVFTFSLLAHHNLKLGMEWRQENSDEWQKELIISYQFMY